MNPDDVLRYGSLELAYELEISRFSREMNKRPTTSAVRVFSKSLHWLAAGWLMSVLWIWAAGVRQHVLRQGVVPDDYAMPLLLTGILSAAALEFLAVIMVGWTGKAPHRRLQRQEWLYAFWWSIGPNAMLLGTAYLMVVAAF